jgi:putative membrane protein
MERRLLRGIINPAMAATWIFGLLLAWQGHHWAEHWLHAKLLLVLVMQLVHALYSRWRRQFAADANTHSDRFYRLWNEVPTVLLILIVILVVVKPF